MASEFTTSDVVIAAGKSSRHYWGELWRYRELLFYFCWRDVTVRYKQTVVGIAWALIRPFLTMLVFTLVFSVVARLPSVGTIPYAMMVLTGLLKQIKAGLGS